MGHLRVSEAVLQEYLNHVVCHLPIVSPFVGARWMPILSMDVTVTFAIEDLGSSFQVQRSEHPSQTEGRILLERASSTRDGARPFL